ncbi:MAG: UDP-glucose 4-epimerase GalE [bacterium]|nr:UDP-glucose 4-epimerase GalE [bacterium]
MRVLVTGGAGYIGSFMTDKLIEENHEVVVVDSLEEGHKDAVNSKATFRQGDLLEKEFVREIFSERQFDAVLHFAAYISMKESMEDPGKYFQNNVQAAVNVLDSMATSHCQSFVFSSTAGVYGDPTVVPIPESHPNRPTNPYGESKYLVERILGWYEKIFGIRSVVFRYFNAAGASQDGTRGEDHRHETHIIPNVIRAVLRNEEFPLFGTDYETEDGTCVRDYIHVSDLVTAHLLALSKLGKEEGGICYYNVGTGTGYSNKQIIDMVEKVSGKKVNVTIKDRRPGDVAMLVANVDTIKQELGFLPQYSDLETIVASAWKWHMKRWEREQR